MDNFIGNFFNGLSDFFSNLFASVFNFIFDFFLNLTGTLNPFITAWLVDQGFELEIPTEIFNVLNEITYGIGYIFPLYALLPIVTIWMTFHIARLTFSIFGGITKTLGLK